MRTATTSLCLLGALLAAGCDDTVSGARPIGGDVPTEASLQRFVRRSTLDLTGAPPTDAELATHAGELRAAGNTVEARAAQVAALMASEKFAALWTEELENRVLGGDTLENRYNFLCGIIRQQSCQTCQGNDSCACQCAQIMPLFPERAELRTTASAFVANTPSSVLERRYAMAQGYRAFLGDAENITTRLFEDFLGRPAELEEREAGRAMIFGFGGGQPAGLLFHRHGGTFDDLVDIAFDSEVYRESVVIRVFNRYLGRAPRSAELAHFVALLNPEEPDARLVISAVLTSKEYFDP